MKKRYHKIAGLFVGLCALLVLSSCTPKKIASDITSQIFKKSAPSFEMESDIQTARETSLGMIKVLEAFSYDNPKNKNLNLLLARSYSNYTQGFLEDTILRTKDRDELAYQNAVKRAKLFYERGRDYGLRNLDRKGSFKKGRMSSLVEFKKSLAGMSDSSVPTLFWTAMNWGSFINLSKDSPLAIAEFPKVEAMMTRVQELDPNYFFGAPHLFFGFAYGSRPKMFGGDPAKAKESFENGLASSQRQFLLGHIYYIMGYAIPQGDVALFDSLVNEILSADATRLPEARLANEIAKDRAKWLQAHKSEIFMMTTAGLTP